MFQKVPFPFFYKRKRYTKVLFNVHRSGILKHSKFFPIFFFFFFFLFFSNFSQLRLIFAFPFKFVSLYNETSFYVKEAQYPSYQIHPQFLSYHIYNCFKFHSNAKFHEFFMTSAIFSWIQSSLNIYVFSVSFVSFSVS